MSLAERRAPFTSSGVLNMIKPAGPSSQDLVTDVKRILHTTKAGHTGTLDPGAAGVLPICVGKATRLFDFLVDKEKRYRCEILFGVQTDTLDSYGKVLLRDDRASIDEAAIQRILPSFIGELVQEPPMFSALKIDGKKMYQRALKGTDAEEERQIRQKKARTIRVESLELIGQTGTNRFMLDLVCSKGTYVRVLCEDIARKLNTVAIMSFLLRTGSGAFSIEDTMTLAELSALAADGRVSDKMIAMDSALAHLPALHVAEKFFVPLGNGNQVPLPAEEAGLTKTNVRVYCDDVFFGIGSCASGLVKIHKMLREDGPK